MQLTELRTAVRSQVELDEDEIPNTLVDLYLREAFQRTVQREQRWPSYEYEWAVTSLVNGRFALPSNLAGLDQVFAESGAVLSHIDHNLAREAFSTSESSSPSRYFSIWGGEIHLWPRPNAQQTIEIRGWRIPTDFAAPGASAASEPDMDARLHLTLVHYAVSRVFAQQEDEILERTYLDSWDRGVEMARAQIMRPMAASPIILNEGLGTPAAHRFRVTRLEA